LSDLKLFRLTNGIAMELSGGSVALEESLQQPIERNMETLFGVQFLPRLICVASGFTRYDEHAVQQMNRSIELVRYRDFSGELLALDLVTSTKVEATTAAGAPAPGVSVQGHRQDPHGVP
jgi:hypothetical protein